MSFSISSATLCIPILLLATGSSTITNNSTPKAKDDAPFVELVESAPIETSLDHADIPNASEVWLAMIDGAKKSLDFAEFYASGHPGSKLDAIVAAVEKAAARGVHVRYLCEEKFYKTYPEIPDLFARTKGMEMRRYDVKKVAGGILHAKFFVVDAREVYIGSQNFDWRSLEHIQELGVRARSPEVAAAVQETFDADWSIAGGGSREIEKRTHRAFPETVGAGKDVSRLTPVFSPKGLLVDADSWELPRIIALIAGAQKSVRVQLLTYKMSSRDGYWNELESALRSAAARGVSVQLLVADWCKRKGTIEGLQGLEPLPNIEVKLVTIPQWSGGFIPYARVVHAKYMVVDDARAWIGTSNWEEDYFYKSRNLGLIIEGGKIPERLDKFFVDDWDSTYAAKVDPCAVYEAPKIGD